MSTDRPPLPWGGFHHVALATPDLERTRAFYRDVLGMDVGDVLVGGGAVPARHCFVRPGADAATWGLHFFEHPDALRARLADAGVEATPTGRVGPLANLLFLDPHGLLLEATWPGGAAAR
jgi:catechol 2,3-dioxygenase-like lactoylglutathione lyase family enzyme